MDDGNWGDFPGTIELAMGMKAMVAGNIAADLDIKNGARGTVVEVILDPDEPPLDDSAIVSLKRLLRCVVVKLDRTRAVCLDSLGEGIILIFPAKCSMQITRQRKTEIVTRLQYPITATYSFADHRSRGQTIPRVAVNIASPPSGKLSPLNP